MEEYEETLKDMCSLHGVIPPKCWLDLKHWEFGSDAREVQIIVNDLHELYYEKCDFDEDETSP